MARLTANDELGRLPPLNTPRRRGFLSWMRIVGLSGMTVYLVTGGYIGVSQQRVGLSSEAIDCDYRVELLRDRVVAAVDRPRHTARDLAGDEVVSTLLRETQAACAPRSTPLRHRLEALDRTFEAYRTRVDDDRTARQEVRAN